MRFRGLDLNLLSVFDCLMQVRSVTAAAKKMNLSQPAMSAALSRLREYFGDPILVAHGKKMFPTAFAESLAPLVRESLGGIETMLATSSLFDPMQSQRTFRIITSDYIVAAVIAPLLNRFASIAPSVKIQIVAPNEASTQLLADGKADLMISPEEFLSSDHPTEILLEETHVVAGWNENPLLAGTLDQDAFSSAGHVAVALGSRSNATFADRHLAQMRIARRVEVTTSTFTTVPWLLVGTRRLAVMHKRFAVAASRIFPITTAPLPFDFPVMTELVQCHQTRLFDDGLSWLRAELRQATNDPLL
ncbi:LysR family transcriptional regulator [Sphingobium sp. HBC34]|uniref:LysR family transcriptional regulator n=1 Tax=Sphingobium cyanobacteriorum TaxID=3063954 RepID=A0ABT8ZRZ7_9SPHN|nr:LysR family transcriptional regulator [Sphingobium sp. HBC34]MDO7837319.1 LysR family transcriptional regulator [Sphingobium sp. HBC34]